MNKLCYVLENKILKCVEIKVSTHYNVEQQKQFVMHNFQLKIISI